MPDAPEFREPDPARAAAPPEDPTLSLGLTYAVQALLAVGLVLFLLRRNWENVFLTSVVILLTLVPAFLSRRYLVVVPPEFQLGHCRWRRPRGGGAFLPG